MLDSGAEVDVGQQGSVSDDHARVKKCIEAAYFDGCKEVLTAAVS